MHAYKSQLLKALSEHGWEVVEFIAGEEWWVDEYWKVQSRHSCWGLEIVLVFLIDPLWDIPRKSGQGVWAISAHEIVPTDRLVAGEGFAELCRVKGRYDENVHTFVTAIDAFRNDRHSTRSKNGASRDIDVEENDV